MQFKILNEILESDDMSFSGLTKKQISLSSSSIETQSGRMWSLINLDL